MLPTHPCLAYPGSLIAVLRAALEVDCYLIVGLESARSADSIVVDMPANLQEAPMKPCLVQ
jgi:hypothetical protein